MWPTLSTAAVNRNLIECARARSSAISSNGSKLFGSHIFHTCADIYLFGFVERREGGGARNNLRYTTKWKMNLRANDFHCNEHTNRNWYHKKQYAHESIVFGRTESKVVNCTLLASIDAIVFIKIKVAKFLAPKNGGAIYFAYESFSSLAFVFRMGCSVECTGHWCIGQELISDITCRHHHHCFTNANELFTITIQFVLINTWE